MKILYFRANNFQLMGAFILYRILPTSFKLKKKKKKKKDGGLKDF